MKAASEIERIVSDNVKTIETQAKNRGLRASNELTSTVRKVLSGQRSGRRYRIRGRGYYTASAPGEPPAVRTGALRLSFKGRTFSRHTRNGINIHAVTESKLTVGKYVLGEMLEKGTKKMKPRPFAEKTLEIAKLKIESIFNEPYV